MIWEADVYYTFGKPFSFLDEKVGSLTEWSHIGII